jgi:putative addiction module killer protein/probable addiction module antidote protein
VKVHHYLTSAGTDPYQRWLDELKDLRGRVAIQRRIDRVANGNFGDHQFCQDGVWELRIHFGPGYRVYYGREGRDSRSFALWWIKTYPIGGHQGSGPLLVRLPAEEKMSRKIKSAVSRSHEEATVESFRKDPAFAAEYLNAVLEDGDQEELMLALRRMSEAFGGVQKLAGRAKLNANTLYRTLSPKGNPELKSLRAVLRAMGMQLTVRPLRKRVA